MPKAGSLDAKISTHRPGSPDNPRRATADDPATAYPRVLTGLALAFCGYALFSAQDATVKWLVVSTALPQILFIRSAVIVGIALAVGGRAGVAEAARSHSKPLIALRAGLILVAWLLFYSAAAHMGLAEITTLYFAAPLMAIGLASLLLGERVGAARWAAAGVGFAGVVVAAGPLGRVAPGPALSALAAAGCWALSTVLVRRIGRTDSTLTQMLSSNALFALACGPTLFWLWRAPAPFELALMLGLGLTGGLGQYLLFESFRHAPASAVAPVEYCGLVWACLYGYAIWADVPGLNTVAGAGLIALGGLSLVWAEGRRSRGAAT